MRPSQVQTVIFNRTLHSLDSGLFCVGVGGGWALGEGGGTSRWVWAHLWVTRRRGTGRRIGHPPPPPPILRSREGNLESFAATRGQQSASNGEAWSWQGSRPDPLVPSALPPRGPSRLLGGAGVPEMAGAHEVLAWGGPTQPLIALQETRLIE